MKMQISAAQKKAMYIFLLILCGQKVRKIIFIPELQNKKPGVFKSSYPMGHVIFCSREQII